MRKVAVFAHYDSNNKIKAYVSYYLQQLNKICDFVVFVTTAKLENEQINKIKHLVWKVILRENVGHDFYSYKLGINAINDLSDVEYLVVCNDSCIGPLFDLQPVFNAMNEKKCDFWGMSANYRPEFHLQSYFLAFNNKVINSYAFQKFWDQLKILEDKDQIVFNYELGLSKQLIKANFKAESYLPAIKYVIKPYVFCYRKFVIWLFEMNNVNSRYSWKNLFEPLFRVDKTITLYDYSIINYKFPWVKKSLFNDRWVKKTEIIDIIRLHTKYDINLLEDFIND